jgi:hypothetical protein
VGILKVFCKKCGKNFGGGTGDHTKNGVNNLFSNFKKSHIMRIGHIKKWHARKGVDFLNHPQSVAAKGKPVILTATDHKRLVSEGLETLKTINDSIDNKPFVLVGDPEVKSFWFKVRCIFYGDFFSL